MQIIFHAHHANISPTMQQRAERAVRKVANRLSRPVDAMVRFEQDGPTRRVEIVLHAAGQRDLVAEGSDKFFGRALGDAVTKLLAQTESLKRTPKERARRLARA